MVGFRSIKLRKLFVWFCIKGTIQTFKEIFNDIWRVIIIQSAIHLSNSNVAAVSRCFKHDFFMFCSCNSYMREKRMWNDVSKPHARKAYVDQIQRCL